MEKKKQSIYTGIICLFFAVAYFIGSFNIKATARYGIFGGSFMPRVYAAVIALCALVQLVSGLRMKVDASEAKGESGLKKSVPALLAFALLFVYILVMRTLGFILSSIVFLFCLCMLLLPKDERSKKTYIHLAIFSVVMPVATYLFFRKVVYMALPSGTIFKSISALLNL